MKLLLCLAALLAAPLAWGQYEHAEPVTPDAMPETRALLKFLQSISGTYTLTGQHNFPATHDRNSVFVGQYTGKTPVIWGSDWGFAGKGDTDSYLVRPEIVKEAIRQNRLGSIIALCWHAIPPTSTEPGTFQPLPGADPNQLKSVQGKLLDSQFRDILTPGTALYKHWCEQVDVIAGYLKQLQDAHVPVLWRPYHEMNGDWFWWGYRTQEPYTTRALYRQEFDRFVNVHHLKNLLWVWNVDRPSRPGMEYDKYFPGVQYCDIVALDAYNRDFGQSYYDTLVRLSQGKVMALAEVGNPPTPDVFLKQPRWTYYMIWAGFVEATSQAEFSRLYSDPRILNLDDPAYWTAIQPYRDAAGFPPLRFRTAPRSLTGAWVLDRERTVLGQMGAGYTPTRMQIQDSGRELAVRNSVATEYGITETNEVNYLLDGSADEASRRGRPWTSAGWRSRDGVIEIDTLGQFSPGEAITTRETWRLADHGETLVIERDVSSSRGIDHQHLVYLRE